MQNLRQMFAATALATALLTTAGAANAAVYTTQSPTGSDGSISWSFGDDGGIPAGAFDEIFNFTIPTAGVWSGTLSTSHTSAENNLTFGPLAATINGINYPLFTTYFQSFDMLPAAAGGATIEVRGTSPGPAGSYVGDLTFTPDSAVPEPAVWAMMALGFGVMAQAMRTHRRRGPSITPA